jgi:hypothetical protein
LPHSCPVSVQPRAPWLGDVDQGIAVATLAPAQVFSLTTGRSASIDTIDGRFQVTPLGPSLPLFALPRAQAIRTAVDVLDRFARDDVFQSWLSGQESKLLATAVCARDQLPTEADVDLTAWVPFLGN